MFDFSVWAALNAQNLQKWEAPEGAEEITVFGDHDRSFTGQAAGYSLARKLTTKGFDVAVKIPPLEGDDWNDILLKSGRT